MTGRNELCHCGSGRKYKRCHFRADVAASSRERLDEQYFGYDATCPADATLFDLPEQGLVCLVFQPAAEDIPDCNECSGQTFSIGNWAVSTGAHESTRIHGPFEELDNAFEYARVVVGAVRFFSAPIIGF